MSQYTHQEERQHSSPTAESGWLNASAISAVVGGVLLLLVGLALFTVLEEAEFAVVDPLGAIAFLLMTLGLPALYLSEREWFARLATVGFALLAGGWIVASIALPVATATNPPVSEALFFGFLVAVLVAIVGAITFGVSILRTDGASTPRIAGWLLVLALPVGVPVAAAFTTYVMGDFADPWAGPFVLLGLAWIVLGRHARRTLTGESTQSTAESA